MISIDSREPTRIKQLLAKKKVSTKGEYLEIGDYLLPGSTIVERKTGADFISSIYDKRIWIQAKNLSQYEHPIIGIISENKWKDFYFRKGRHIHKSWISTIATLSSRYNISVLTFDSEGEFIDYLVALDNKLSSEKDSVRPDPIARKPTSLQERKENTLCAAEGVSIKTAQQILECYGSVENVANETIEGLQKIKGIGEKTAQSIYDLFQ